MTKQQVRDMLRSREPMLKFNDNVTLSAVPVDFAGVITYLSQIPLSSSGAPNQRIGNNVELDSLELRYTWGSPVSFADVYSTCRLIIGQWKGVYASWYNPGAGSSPLVPDVLQDSSLGAVSGPLAPFAYFGSKESSHAYKVLYDKIVRIGPGGPVADGDDVFLSLKGVSSFTGTTGAATESSNGGLFLVAVTDSGATPDPLLSYSIRTWWRDGRD